MTLGREEEIHRRFGQFHKVLVVLVAAEALLIPTLFVLAATASVSDQRRGTYFLGIALSAVIAIGNVLMQSIVYLVSQRSARIHDGHLIFRSWIRFGPFGRVKSVELASIRNALLLRPHHVHFTLHGVAEALEETTPYTEQIGTFWWRKADYLALRGTLIGHGVPTEFRQLPGLGTLLSSW